MVTRWTRPRHTNPPESSPNGLNPPKIPAATTSRVSQLRTGCTFRGRPCTPRGGTCPALFPFLVFVAVYPAVVVYSQLLDRPLPEGVFSLFAFPVCLQRRALRGKMPRSEEHTSELQSHSFISYAVFCLKKK